MRLPALLLIAVGFTGAFILARAAEPAAKSDPTQVTLLIKQLGSPRFAEREAATQALDALGPPVLAALQAALRSEDAEVRRRVQELVPRIQRRAETIRLLAPRHIRLVYKDTPITEVVDDFAKKTGFTIQIGGERGKVLGRRITLDTGETTYWEAYARLCKEAGLSEHVDPNAGADSRFNDRAQRGGTRVIDLRHSNYSPCEARLVLMDGHPGDAPPPTFHAGALRIRALPSITAVAGQARGDGETLFALDLTPEPGLLWQTVLGMRIERAIDDRGQKLTQPAAFVGGGVNPQSVQEDVVIIVEDGTVLPVNDARLVPVRLKLGKEPAKQVKELKGTLTAQMLGLPERLATVDNVLKSAGQVVKAGDGTTLRVLAVSRQEDGEISLRVELQSRAPDMNLGRFPGRIIRVNRGLRSRTQRDMPTEGGEPILALQNAKGEAFRLDACALDSGTDGTRTTKLFNLTYPPQKEQGEPVKLVFTGRRLAVVEVPFTLKDVPLP